MSVSRWEIMLDSYAAANPREAQGTFYAELRRMLARVSELEQENERLNRRLSPGQGEGYANEVERQRVVIDGLTAAAGDYKARAERAEAQVRAALASVDEILAEQTAYLPEGVDHCEIAANDAYETAAEILRFNLSCLSGPAPQSELRLAEQHARAICEALGEQYEPNNRDEWKRSFEEMLPHVKARSDAWRALLARIEVVDPKWLDEWRKAAADDPGEPKS